MINFTTLCCRAIASGVIIFLAVAPVPAMPAQGDPGDALRDCAAIQDSAARLDCYDEVAEARNVQQGQATEPAPEEPETPVDDSGPEPLTDEIGKDVSSDGERRREIYAATVTGCEHQRRRNEFFFILENGQVWKMSNFRRPIVGECEFDVTIERDFFGFKMDIPSKDASFRVSRVN